MMCNAVSLGRSGISVAFPFDFAFQAPTEIVVPEIS